MKINELFGNIFENSSAGATGASSVATTVGALGSGFSNDYTKSVYGPQVIRRMPSPVKKKKTK